MSGPHPRPRPVRSRIVTVRFAPDEHAELMAAASQHSLSASQMLRASLGYACIPPPKTDAATAAQLGRIGGNLWQLIREIRRGHCTHNEAVVEELRQVIMAINLRLLRVDLAKIEPTAEAPE